MKQRPPRIVEAPPVGQYVERNDQQALRAPYRWSDLRFYHFMVGADRAHLQRRVDRFLNHPLGLHGADRRYRVTQPWALIYFTDITEWRSVEESRGFFTKRRAGLWIPIECDAWTEPGAIGFHPAYEFIDSGVARTSGREVFGFPIDFAYITVADEVTGVPGGGGTKLHALPCGFSISCSLVDHRRPDRISQQVQLMRLLQMPGTGLRRGVDPAGGAPPAKHSWLARLVQLKQFRDATDSSRACCQTVTEVPIRARVRQASLLDGRYQLHVKQVESHPLATGLGLDVRQFNDLHGVYLGLAEAEADAAIELEPASRAQASRAGTTRLPRAAAGGRPAGRIAVIAEGTGTPPALPRADAGSRRGNGSGSENGRSTQLVPSGLPVLRVGGPGNLYPGGGQRTRLVRTRASAAALPRYIEEADGDALPGPTEAGDVRMYGFAVPATVSRLQEVCDKFFGVPSGGAVEYRAFIPAVLLYFSALREASSCSTAPGARALLEYAEAGIWIPMVRVERGEAKALVIYPQYTFLDNPLAAVTGREVYGMYKELSDLVVPVDPDASSFRLRPTVLEQFSAETLAEAEILLSMIPLYGSRGGRLRNVLGMTGMLLEGLANLRRQGVRIGRAFLAQIASMIVHGRPRFAFLKQFRHARDAQRASYQAIVEAPFDITSFRTLRLLPGVYNLIIDGFASHPLVENLGLPSGNLSEMRGFMLDMGFVFEDGEIIWEA